MPKVTPRGAAAQSNAVVQTRAVVKANTNVSRASVAQTTPAQTEAAPQTPAPTAAEPATPGPTDVVRPAAPGSAATEVTLDPQRSALARKEQKYLTQIREFEVQKQAFEAEKGNFIPKSSILDSVNRGKASEALKALGLSYDQLTQALLAEQNGGDPNREAIVELTSEVQNLRTQVSESTKKQTETVIKQYEAEISKLVDSDPEFETIKAKKANAYVLQHILDTFDEDNEILTVEQAAKEIEEQLLEEAVQLAALKKVQAKISPPAPSPNEKKLPPPQSQRSGVRTIPNDAVATSQGISPKQMQHMNERERLAEAIRRAAQKQQLTG